MLKFFRSGRAIVSLDTTAFSRPLLQQGKQCSSNKGFPALPMEEFHSHYVVVYDMTLLKDAAEQLHYSEVRGENFRIERFF